MKWIVVKFCKALGKMKENYRCEIRTHYGIQPMLLQSTAPTNRAYLHCCSHKRHWKLSLIIIIPICIYIGIYFHCKLATSHKTKLISNQFYRAVYSFIYPFYFVWWTFYKRNIWSIIYNCLKLESNQSVRSFSSMLYHLSYWGLYIYHSNLE